MAGLRVCLQAGGWALVAVLAVAAAPAFAADLQDPTASFDGLLQLVQQTSAAWGPKLQGYAVKLFWLLATIQFTWSMGMLAFKSPDFGELFGELFRQVMVIGFWFAFLMFSVEWNTAIIDSFREAGAAAAGSSKALVPSDMFSLAVDFATKIAQSGAGLVSPMNPFAQVLTSISAIIVLLCFAFIAVLMLVALFESYIVVNAGVMMMGFAGSSWTRDMTLQFLKYGVSVGAKLFVLTLLVGLITQASSTWADAYQPMSADGSSTFTLLGLALCCAYCCKTIPELIQGVIAGVSPGGGGAIGGIAAAGIAAAAATAAVAKTVATGGAAAPAAAGALGNAANSVGSAAGVGAGETLTSTGGAAGGEGAGTALNELGEGVGRGGAAPGDAADSSEGGGAGDVGDSASESGDGGDGQESGEDEGGPSAANDEEYNSGTDVQDESGDGSDVEDGAATSGGEGQGDASKNEGKSSLGGLFEAGRHAGRGAYAAAAMVTPGIDTSPSADGLATGPGNLKGGGEKGGEDGSNPSAAPQADNVIKPDTQPEGTDSKSGGKTDDLKPPAKD
uniref:Putative mating pair formation protein n=1 Tax=Stenotrophomonas maltophilia TaxID=40324 RepID=Q7WZL7_STEMA|nr:putative mating pair formation protein [Stenotrophomonas maltophilia]